MKPLMLHGHERSITQIKYNVDGDLLFSCSKDTEPNVWYSLNGERLGSFQGHTGAVWCIDVDYKSEKVATGAADNSCRLWDLETGKTLSTIKTNTAVRTDGFSCCGDSLMFTTDQVMGHPCSIQIFDIRDLKSIESGAAEISIDIPKEMMAKVTSSLWGPTDETIITGHDDGHLTIWDIKTKEKLTVCKEHYKSINDMQYSKDLTMFITASKDYTAKLFDTKTLDNLKMFKTERNVNSAAISPIKEHVVLGGGQEAMEVTTTSSRVGKFFARFYHLVYEEEISRVKGHFGPINSVAFHPTGSGYSSGGEDGFIRIHTFDPQYYEFDLLCDTNI